MPKILIKGPYGQDAFFKQLESMLEPFYIDLTQFRLLGFRSVSTSYGLEHKFNKHISSSNDPVGTSTYYDDLSSNNFDGDDPFKPL